LPIDSIAYNYLSVLVFDDGELEDCEQAYITALYNLEEDFINLYNNIGRKRVLDGEVHAALTRIAQIAREISSYIPPDPGDAQRAQRILSQVDSSVYIGVSETQMLIITGLRPTSMRIGVLSLKS
jgi:hypothetical protein